MKLIRNLSHQDDGIPDNIAEWVMKKNSDVKGFIATTLKLCPGLDKVDNALYGPICGDDPVKENEVRYEKRGTRGYSSRVINRPMRKSNEVSLIAGPHEGHDDIIVYTIFGGPISPQEVGQIQEDMQKAETEAAPEFPKALIENLELKLEESKTFWAQHALSVEAH